MARAIALNGRISQQKDPEGLLRLVGDELPSFNDVNVSTAFSRFYKLSGSRSFPRNIAADNGFRGLMARACTMCAECRLDPQAVANIVHGVAKMSAAGKLDAADAGVQDMLAALEQRMVRAASDMNAYDVSNTVYALAVLGWAPGTEARAALEAAAVRVGLSMNGQDVGNLSWAFATLGLTPGVEAQVALEAAVVRVGPVMKPQHTANTLWSFATLGLMPGAETRAALEAAVVRVGPSMTEQEVANTVLAYATLRLTPGAEALAALEAAVVRVGPSMTPQGVANALWSFPTMAATQSLPLPTCYPSLWRLVHGLDVGSFKDVHLYMLFHAHLILTELVGGDVLDEVTFPPWIMHEAREAWMRNIRDDVTVSKSHKEMASIIGELGILCEVECLSDCGYFSIDVVLPDHDVAIEFDGPTHFIIFSDGGKGGAPGNAASRTTKTVKTELRDKFLGRRYRTVVSVPWFEWAELNDKGAAEKKAYVVAKLTAAGVNVTVSA
jgi:hypothetical protein